jgi:hypothetical protein
MFAKVFQKMLDSSVWTESTSTRIVWITFLLSMDSDGFCEFASAENVATRARVKLCHTREAISILESPDPQSKTPDDDGRRIQRVQGGWLVLNCKKYRDIANHGDLRKSRLKSSQVVSSRSISSQVVSSTHLSTNEINKSLPEIEIETEKEKTNLALVGNRPDTASDVAAFVMQGLGLAGRENRWTIEDAIKRSMESFDLPAMGAAAQIVTSWQEYEVADVEPRSRSGPGGFLKDGKFLSKTRWRLRGADGEQKQGKLEQLRALRKANGQDGGELAVFDGGSTTGESKGGRVPETL